MSIAFLSSAHAEATSLTLPSHQAGDLLVMACLRVGSNAPATIPSGWVNCGVGAGLNSDNFRVSYKIASSDAEVSETWTNASLLAVAVYRPAANYHYMGANYGSRSAGGGTISPRYQTKVANNTNLVPGSISNYMQAASSIVLGVISDTGNTATLSAPTGMTNRVMATASHQIAIHDTGAANPSWPTTNQTLDATATWQTAILELIDTGVPIAAAGGSSNVTLLQPSAIPGA